MKLMARSFLFCSRGKITLSGSIGLPKGVGRFSLEYWGAKGEWGANFWLVGNPRGAPSPSPTPHPSAKSFELCKAISVHFCILGTFKVQFIYFGYFSFVLKSLEYMDKAREILDCELSDGGT